MLSKFCVENFKGFSQRLEFDLSRTGNYEFNQEAVKNGIVNKGLIYGFNGCGKSNLGLAIFDIISHLTDKNCNEGSYRPYQNLDSDSKVSAFEYHFVFGRSTVIYIYRKEDLENLLYEELFIDGQSVIQYDFKTHTGFVRLAGTENMNLEASEAQLSRVKYVRSNAILADTPQNKIFSQFISFVDRMLLFYSLENNRYQGFKSGREYLGTAIIKAGKTKEFERFLRESNVDIQLTEGEIDGRPALMAHYKNADVSFFRIASQGSRSLALLYYWYIVLEKASFVFIDEFDAFYHFELAERIVRMLKEFTDVQILFTTHNTDLLSNDLLRPDCFFWMCDSKITPISDLTEKELRKAHNLQKMFKAGAFNAK